MPRVDNQFFFEGTPTQARRRPKVDGTSFYARHEASRHWFEDLMAKEYRFAFAVFLMGFLAVFVNQMPIYFQVVVGAPIFEEMFKFGLALVLVLPIRFPILRIPLAFAIGAGFGVLEHYATYSIESDFVYAWRIAFHSLSTGVSMAFYCLLRDESRLIWPAAMAPSILIHYINNTGAVILLVVAPGWDDSIWFSATNVALLTLWVLWASVFQRTGAKFPAKVAHLLWPKALASERQNAAKAGSGSLAEGHKQPNEAQSEPPN